MRNLKSIINEEWRPVGGFEGVYEVSDQGRIRRIAKASGTSLAVLKPALNTNGYYYVNLTHAAEEKSKMARVNVLVCEAFHGPRPFPRAHTRHLNSDPLDNRAENLCWGTPKENARDRELAGNTARGERSGNAKLTVSKVIEIRRLACMGLTQDDIGDLFGICQSAVSQIVNRKTWRHILSNYSEVRHAG